MSKNIEKLIVKFLNKEANFDELQQLEVWISNPNNEALFLEFIKINASINKSMNKYNKVKAKENIIRRIKKEKEIVANNSKRSLSYKYAAAASIALIVSLTILFNKNSDQQQLVEPIIVNNQIKQGTDKAILTLESGEEIALVKGVDVKISNATSNGKEIIYNKEAAANNKIAYNYLTIPRGGQYEATLSDGTVIWLNSESQLKFPVSFQKGAPRSVELVYGEAYFDVSSSTNHNGTTFLVINKNQKVEVLGTEFNIKAYKDETNIYTTLIEGKVAVNYKNTGQILKPNQQSIINTNTNKISITEVDTYNEVAWRKGVFAFKEKTLKEIVKVLSRWYDVEIEFKNKKIEEITFNGVLIKSQKLEDILETIKITNQINYTINGKNIAIE
ncbi:FecR family protein [Polaribacter vadi]|uniref:FecR family protein n=1 Tax=Polaribacter vadi TaxID=1774273 RepID=UPI0030ED72E1